MKKDWLFALTFASTLGCGLIAGVFYAFSTFVMQALAQLAPSVGIAAMQSINLVVINPWFLGVLFGTAAACLVLMGCSVSAWRSPRSICLLSGGLLYLFGTMLVTIYGNVPWNDTLAAVDPAGSGGARLWAEYVVRWTNWNHARGAAALMAGALFTFALSIRSPLKSP